MAKKKPGPQDDAGDAVLSAAKRTAVEQYLNDVPHAEAMALAVSTTPKHNVVGVGVGRKIKGGVMLPTRCVRFYVERKVGEEAMPPGSVLPKQIGGVPTDVIESGRFYAQKAPLARTRMRPAHGGCSIGFQFTGAMAGYVMAGTLGALVKHGTKTCLLSNNHVLANENSLPLSSPIFQPGLLDHGNPAKDAIAKLSKFVPLRGGGVANRVDCAIAEVLSPHDVAATILASVGALASKDPVPAAMDMLVHKHGRTTGYTKGKVFDLEFTGSIHYEMGSVKFEDQVLVQGDAGPFSDSGDSGSLIVDRATNRATALLFAGSSAYTIGNRIENVLAALGVTLKV